MVGQDDVGPVANKIASLSMDGATGFIRSTFHTWSTAKSNATKLEEYQKHLTLDHVKWIKVKSNHIYIIASNICTYYID